MIRLNFMSNSITTAGYSDRVAVTRSPKFASDFLIEYGNGNGSTFFLSSVCRHFLLCAQCAHTHTFSVRCAKVCAPPCMVEFVCKFLKYIYRSVSVEAGKQTADAAAACHCEDWCLWVCEYNLFAVSQFIGID